MATNRALWRVRNAQSELDEIRHSEVSPKVNDELAQVDDKLDSIETQIKETVADD